MRHANNKKRETTHDERSRTQTEKKLQHSKKRKRTITLGILEEDIIKQVEMKEKIKKEYFIRTRKLLETKLNCRNLIKKTNTWAVYLVRYSRQLLKWTRKEF